MPSRPSTSSRTTWTKPSGTRKQLQKQLCDSRSFLYRTGYPYAPEWTVPLLGRAALHLLRSGTCLLGLVWFQPVRPGVARLHLATHALIRGAWVTPSTLRYLSTQCRDAGFHTVLASPIKSHEGMVKRMGFVWTSEGYALSMYTNGLPKNTGTATTTAT